MATEGVTLSKDKLVEKALEMAAEAILYAKSCEAEIARLKSGNLTHEEFQNLCHNLHLKKDLPCTREEFEAGCRKCQDEIFGVKNDESTAHW